MKKFFVVIAVLFAAVFTVSAQPKAIGARLGYGPVEISYEHYLSDPNFAEIDLGAYSVSGHTGAMLTGIYNWTFAQPDWTRRGSWAWYAGPGVVLGSVPVSDSDNQWSNSVLFGIAGQIGLEYEFWFPLQLSADIRPILGYSGGTFWDTAFNSGNIFFPVISVRYKF